MSVYFTAEVVSVGEEAPSLIDGGVTILFAQPCPDALAEVAIVHRVVQADEERSIEPGDVLRIGGSQVVVAKVGSLATENLRKLGHIVVYSDPGEDQALLPGAVHATGPLAAPQAGDAIEFASGS